MRIAACLLALTGLAHAEAADITEVKDKLTVWSDGKNHYVAMVMTSNSSSPIFWSADGKSFHQLRMTSGSSDGYDDNLKMLIRNFWEPRNPGSGEAGLEYFANVGKLVVQCDVRKTPLEKVEAEAAKKLIGAAQFNKSRWPRYAYALARDNTGRYFYVDNVREPENAKQFRLFAGLKGSMKLQKMTNIVSDSSGDIFSTVKGELRLILQKQDSAWVVKNKPTHLTWLPVEDNRQMIYTELGVYAGQELGTPCDVL
jgi:hypothetical protein